MSGFFFRKGPPLLQGPEKLNTLKLLKCDRLLESPSETRQSPGFKDFSHDLPCSIKYLTLLPLELQGEMHIA